MTALLVLACAVLGTARAETQPASRITLLTEDRPPVSWAAPDGTLHGNAIDNAHELMRRAGVPYDLKMLPWARAYTETLQQPNSCIFGMAVTKDRRAQFKWITSFWQTDISLYAPEGSALTISSIEDVRRQGLKIGVELGDISEVMLQEIGGFNLDGVTNRVFNVRKLAAGRIDLWASGPVGVALAEKTEGLQVKPLITVGTVDVGIACNRATDDGTIGQMQQALDSMHKDGSLHANWDRKDTSSPRS